MPMFSQEEYLAQLRGLSAEESTLELVHDLRNPTASILAHIEVIKNLGALDERDISEFYNSIEDAIDSILVMLDACFTSVLGLSGYEVVLYLIHDLRNPTATILGYIDLINKSDTIDQSELSEIHNIIEDAAHNLSIMLDAATDYLAAT